MDTYQSKNFINGSWWDASSGETFAVLNPATGRTLAHVPFLSSNDVQEAISAAEHALNTWREAPARKRSDILLAISQALVGKTEELAQIITAEQGKPLAEARGEIAYASSYFRWFSEEAVRVTGDIIPADSPSKRIFVLKQPVGVVAAITPWNFPIAMLARKMAAALAAGCTFIAKPAPETPLSALARSDFSSRGFALHLSYRYHGSESFDVDLEGRDLWSSERYNDLLVRCCRDNTC